MRGNDPIDRFHRFIFIAMHYGTVKLTGHAYIVNRVIMQLLLSSSCASRSFHGGNVIFITALYRLQKLKVCVLIKMMFSNLVK